MWSKPEYESKSVSTCSLSTHCTHCTCLFHEQRLQVLPGKCVKCLQVSKTQTSVQTWRENQGPESTVKSPWSSTESRSVPTVILSGQRKETELVTFWWKLSTRKTVRQEDIQKVSMVLTTLHHPKEEIKKKKCLQAIGNGMAQFSLRIKKGTHQWKTTDIFSLMFSWYLLPQFLHKEFISLLCSLGQR